MKRSRAFCANESGRVNRQEVPMRALALSAGRRWLIPVSAALFVISSPLFLLAWIAYPIAGLAALGVAKSEGAEDSGGRADEANPG